MFRARHRGHHDHGHHDHHDHHDHHGRRGRRGQHGWLRGLFFLLPLPLVIAACGGSDGVSAGQQVQSLGNTLAARFAERVLERAFSELDARPEQRAAVREIARKLLAEHSKLRAARDDAMATLRAQWVKDKMDADAVAAARQRIDNATLAMSRAISGAIVELHGVLDAKQRAQVSAHLERLRRRHHRRATHW